MMPVSTTVATKPNVAQPAQSTPRFSPFGPVANQGGPADVRASELVAGAGLPAHPTQLVGQGPLVLQPSPRLAPATERQDGALSDVLDQQRDALVALRMEARRGMLIGWTRTTALGHGSAPCGCVD